MKYIVQNKVQILRFIQCQFYIVAEIIHANVTFGQSLRVRLKKPSDASVTSYHKKINKKNNKNSVSCG